MKVKSELLERFGKYKNATVNWYNKLTMRERVLVAVPLAVAIVLMVHFYIIQPVGEAVAAQREAANQAETQIRVFGEAVKEFARLKARRVQIEEEYKEVESKDSPRAVLESLIKNKLGLPSRDFTLPDPRTEEFGGEYEITTVNVGLRNLSDLEKLVDFLKEVVKGPNPFILKHLDLDKGLADRFLKVDFEASTIRHK